MDLNKRESEGKENARMILSVETNKGKSKKVKNHILVKKNA